MMGSVIRFVSPRDRRLRGLLVGMLLVCTTILTPSFRGTPARASFPGENGRIAFVLEQNGFGDIYTMDPDGTDRMRLEGNSAYDDRNPVFSPDGTRIAFESNRDGNLEIYVMYANGIGAFRLTNAAGSDVNPSWSPDGSTIVFSSQRDPNAELYTVPVGGGTNVRLTNTAAGEHAPAWSPDGSTIAYENNGPDGIQIYSIPAAGGTPTRLTQDDTGGRSPNWSSDGSQIVFNRALEMWGMEATGAAPRLLVDHGRIGVAAPAPDGAGIVFSSDAVDGSNDDIWFSPSPGDPPQRLTTDPLDELEPDWGPVGPAGPDLVVSQTGPADPVPVGTNYAYTITITNMGTVTANNVTAVHHLEPDANSWHTHGGFGVQCAVYPDSSYGETIRCPVGSLTPGQSITGTVKARANAVGTWTGTASAAYDQIWVDPTPFNNRQAVETTVMRGQSSMSVKVELNRRDEILISGTLSPAMFKQALTVILKDEIGRRTKIVETTGGGASYEAVFNNRGGRDCLVRAKFLGNSRYEPSMAGKSFSCAGGRN